jgi:hypothetical protein
MSGDYAVRAQKRAIPDETSGDVLFNVVRTVNKKSLIPVSG